MEQADGHGILRLSSLCTSRPERVRQSVRCDPPSTNQLVPAASHVAMLNGPFEVFVMSSSPSSVIVQVT
jgi:hypothetical protein